MYVDHVGRKVQMKFVWSIPRSSNFYFELCAYYKEEMGLRPGPAKKYILHFVNEQFHEMF